MAAEALLPPSGYQGMGRTGDRILRNPQARSKKAEAVVRLSLQILKPRRLLAGPADGAALTLQAGRLHQHQAPPEIVVETSGDAEPFR